MQPLYKKTIVKFTLYLGIILEALNRHFNIKKENILYIIDFFTYNKASESK